MLRTAGNFNTDVGLPLTILSATGDEAAWVLEMAMRGRGEIAVPDRGRAARTSASSPTSRAAHLETLGAREIARAKGELFAGLGAERLGGAARRPIR